MGTAATQSAMDEKPHLVAPIWHTIVYFGFLIALTYWVHLIKAEGHRSLPSAHLGRSWAYVLGFAVDGILLGLMYLGLCISKTRLSELMGPGWADRNQVRRDIIVGALFSLVLLAVSVLMLVSFPPHKDPDKSLELFLPRSFLQFILFFSWLASAGFFEELTFRGYLFRQLNHFVGINSAIAIQAIVFAALHGFNQSVGEAAAKFVVGGFLGVLAIQRKSLFPGMIAHGCLNGLSAVVIGLLQIFR